MAERSGIQWCDATFNPWVGCEKVSPGCAHCYAETLVTGRMGRPGTWGADGVRQVTSDANWRKPLRWARLAREGRLPDGSPNVDGHRPRVFCASLADVFEDRPELDEPRYRLFELIVDTPELDWLVLTKRPEFAREWLARWYDAGEQVFSADAPWSRPTPLPNVWLGVSIENARHTWRADVLRDIPAAVRFISAEPLLGSLYKDRLGGQPRDERAQDPGERPPFESQSGASPSKRAPLDLTGIDWVIIGGESGAGARPMRLEWAREIIYAAKRQECCGRWTTACCGSYLPTGECCGEGEQVCCYEPDIVGPAVFVKQLGAKPVQMLNSPGPLVAYELRLRDRKGGDPSEWPAALRIREHPASAAVPA